jgi:hypothetical protein
MDWMALFIPIISEMIFATAQGLFAFYVCPSLVRPLIISSGQLITAIPIILKIIYEIQDSKYEHWKLRTKKIVKLSICALTFVAGTLVTMVAASKSPALMGHEIILGACCLFIMSGSWWVNFVR